VPSPRNGSPSTWRERAYDRLTVSRDSHPSLLLFHWKEVEGRRVDEKFRQAVSVFPGIRLSVRNFSSSSTCNCGAGEEKV